MTTRPASDNTYTSLDEKNQIELILKRIESFDNAQKLLHEAILQFVESQLDSYGYDTDHATKITRDILRDVDNIFEGSDLLSYDIPKMNDEYTQ